MNPEKPEPSTRELVEHASQTRRHVAKDVERLANALTPAHLKDRALEHAEHSLERWEARALRTLRQAPQKIASYALTHPVVSAAAIAGTVAIVWRLSVARRR